MALQIEQVKQVRELVTNEEAVGYFSTFPAFADMHPMTLQEGLTQIFNAVETEVGKGCA